MYTARLAFCGPVNRQELHNFCSVGCESGVGGSLVLVSAESEGADHTPGEKPNFHPLYIQLKAVSALAALYFPFRKVTPVGTEAAATRV